METAIVVTGIFRRLTPFKSSYEEWKRTKVGYADLLRRPLNLPMRNGNKNETIKPTGASVAFKSSYEEWKRANHAIISLSG